LHHYPSSHQHLTNYIIQLHHQTESSFGSPMLIASSSINPSTSTKLYNTVTPSNRIQFW
jgi:hypothetical protein